jgi:Fe-S oxidoreductase
MHIESHHDTIRACRFCFMCRHLSPIGNVTFRESDTPRGRALLLDKVVADPSLLDVPEFAAVIYDADLSAACRYHCVSHYDEVGLILAARRCIVESGRPPAEVVALAKEIGDGAITTRGDGPSEVVYYVDQHTALHHPEISAAMESVLTTAGLSYRIVSGADSGKALKVLGYWDEARKLAAKMADALTVPSARTILVSCPAAYDAFVNDYPLFGTPLGEGVEILHSSELILRLVKEGRLKGNAPPGMKVFPLASDYLKNYNNGNGTVEAALAAMGVEIAAFGTNKEESYTAGEGAVVLDRLNPGLVEKLCRYILARIDDPAKDVLLTVSPYTKYALLKYGGKGIRITTVEEIARAWVQGSLWLS